MLEGILFIEDILENNLEIDLNKKFREGDQF
jgi:hypothetical protein